MCKVFINTKLLIMSAKKAVKPRKRVAKKKTSKEYRSEHEVGVSIWMDKSIAKLLAYLGHYLEYGGRAPYALDILKKSLMETINDPRDEGLKVLLKGVEHKFDARGHYFKLPKHIEEYEATRSPRR